MAEIRKSSASLPSQMTVIEGGQGIARASSGNSAKRTVKKMPSEGLIALSPEPVAVQFDEAAMGPGSGGAGPGSRAGSAGRIEKKLQVARKQELSQEEPRRSSAGARLSSPTTEPLSVRKLHFADGVKKKATQGPAMQRGNEAGQDAEEDSSETSSESSSDEEEAEARDGVSKTSNSGGAPVELKGEFLKCIMDEDYARAQELCKQILLLEPDNATCSEFHSVIHEKMKQDEEQEDDDDDDDDGDEDDESTDSEEEGDNEDDDDDDDDEDDDDDDDDDSDDESESDDDASLPQGPINLLMGGLPIRPHPR